MYNSDLYLRLLPAVRGPLLEYLRGAAVLLEINICVGKMGEINKWPQ